MLRQFLAIAALSARNFPNRFKASLVIVIALICVTSVLLPLLAIEEGLRLAYLQAGDPGRAVVLSAGARHADDSRISPALLAVTAKAPGIARARSGAAIDAENAVFIHPYKKASRERGNAQLRGIGPQGFLLRPEFHLVSGRLPHPGAHEILAGVLARAKFAGLDPGQKIELVNVTWRVVGVFETGSTLEGDVVADVGALKAAIRRDSYNIVLLRLNSPDALTVLQAALRYKPLMVMRETDYYRWLWLAVPAFPLFVAYMLGFLVALGAVSGTLYTMVTATETRAGEIAVLRAIGFDGRAVAACVVAEAMLLACLGAIIGTMIDWAWQDGYVYNGGIEGGVFRVAVTWHLLAVAIGWALVIALAGAVQPALRVARGTVADALRDL